MKPPPPKPPALRKVTNHKLSPAEIVLAIVVIIYFVVLFTIAMIEKKEDPTPVIIPESVVSERPAMVEYDGQWFPEGSKLTSKENGEVIMAPPGTPDEEIIGIATNQD